MLVCISSAFKEGMIVLDSQPMRAKVLSCEAKHSEKLLPALEEVLQEGGFCQQDITEIALVRGPGSFTGLRIGASLAKGLCLGLDIDEVIPISSLDLIAHSFVQGGGSGKFVATIDALGGRLFVAEFDGVTRLGEDRLVPKAQVEGLRTVGLLEENVASEKVAISPQTLLSLAKSTTMRQKASSFVPTYLRLSQAEENLK